MREPKLLTDLRHYAGQMLGYPFRVVTREEAQDLLNHIDQGMRWQPAGEVDMTDDSKRYLVKDNGGEWRDMNIHYVRAIQLRHMMRPECVRGRPIWVMEIKNTPDGKPINEWS